MPLVAGSQSTAICRSGPAVGVGGGGGGTTKFRVAGKQGPSTVPSGLAGGVADGLHVTVDTALSSETDALLSVSVIDVAAVTLSAKLSPEMRSDDPSAT